jgi:hypothetical protein
MGADSIAQGARGAGSKFKVQRSKFKVSHPLPSQREALGSGRLCKKIERQGAVVVSSFLFEVSGYGSQNFRIRLETRNERPKTTDSAYVDAKSIERNEADGLFQQPAKANERQR